eukprot:scaffold129939_cov36-Tisochrysis_lutea.AAC.2
MGYLKNSSSKCGANGARPWIPCAGHVGPFPLADSWLAPSPRRLSRARREREGSDMFEGLSQTTTGWRSREQRSGWMRTSIRTKRCIPISHDELTPSWRRTYWARSPCPPSALAPSVTAGGK